MKRLLAAAAVMIGLSSPALAQNVRVHVGEGMREGRSVETIRYDRGRHAGWRHKRMRGCRVIVTRTQRPNGTVVVRKVRRCR